jgi:AcrR family transcriptional regulator
MGRPAKFRTEEILAATAQLVATGGPSAATVAGIAESLGAPTGSIYHRFGSRDLLVARVWVWAAREAQRGFLDALALPDVHRAAVEAAVHLPRWCRAHLDLARVLVLHRREDLVAQWPDELGADLHGLNDEIVAALRQYTKRRYRQTNRQLRELVLFALVDVPYGAVRRHLIAGVAPPPQVDDLVRSTCEHVLAKF